MTAAVLEDKTWSGDALQLLARVAESGEDFDAYALERSTACVHHHAQTSGADCFAPHTQRRSSPPLVSISQNAADDQAACVASGADSPTTPTGRPQHE